MLIGYLVDVHGLHHRELVGPCERAVVIQENLFVGPEGANEVQQPPLFGLVHLVDTAVVEDVAARADAVEIPEQQLD